MLIQKTVIIVISSLLLLSFFVRSKLIVKSGFTVYVDEAKTFKKLLDFEAIPSWNSTVLSSKNVEPGPVRIGSGFIEVRKGLFGTNEMNFKVLSLNPENFLKVEGRSGKKIILFEFHVSRIDDLTKVDLMFTESDMPVLLSILLKPIYQRSVDTNMKRLKQLAQI